MMYRSMKGIPWSTQSAAIKTVMKDANMMLLVLYDMLVYLCIVSPSQSISQVNTSIL
jgi:hypothetical protein